MRRLGWLLSVLAVGACCPDPPWGTSADFTAGPTTAPAYAISAVADCDVGPEPIYIPAPETIAVVGTGPDPARVVTAGWLDERLLPALTATGLTPTGSGPGPFCAAGGAVIYVKIDSWHDADDFVRAIAAALAADQLQGEVDLVVAPPGGLC